MARVDKRPWILAPLAGDGLVAFDYRRRRPVWQTEPGTRVVSTPAIDDLDGDGLREVVATTLDGRLLVLDLRGGRPLCDIEVSDHRMSGAPGVGDLNGDGLKDIVVADHGFAMTVLDGLIVAAARARASR